ncbi:MAG: ABC-type transport auxiliary lipoprotein family protein [Myxococcota bacterium]
MSATPPRFPLVALAVALVAGAASAACIGGSSLTPTYFALEAPPPVAAPRAPFPATIRVRRFEAAAAYDRQELVYRSGQALRFDAYRLWVTKPARMLREAVARHLADARLFRAVVGRSGGESPDYELAGEVITLDELDVAPREWQARLAMRFELVRASDGAVVWQHAFAAERPVTSGKPADVVAALDAILADELATLSDGLTGYLAGLPATGQPAADSTGPR